MNGILTHTQLRQRIAESNFRCVADAVAALKQEFPILHTAQIVTAYNLVVSARYRVIYERNRNKEQL